MSHAMDELLKKDRREGKLYASKAVHLALLDETIEYYGEAPVDRRSLNDEPVGTESRCLYSAPDGNKCAVGRILTPEQLEIAHANEGEACSTIILKLDDEGLRTGRIAIIHPSFLEKVQELHDVDEAWDEDGGLTEFGKENALDTFEWLVNADNHLFEVGDSVRIPPYLLTK